MRRLPRHLLFLIFTIAAVGPFSQIAEARLTGKELCTPETSSLFHKETDPESGVVSYVLNADLIAPNQQSVYFVNKSMTEDGRFLLFWTADDETKTKQPGRGYALVDFEKDIVIKLDFPRNQYFNFYSIDPKTDRLYYVVEDGVFYRDLKRNPHKEIKVCNIPQGLKDEGVVDYFFTHLTMTDDGSKIFVDNRIPGQDKWLQGAIDIKHGKWERWTTTDFIINHGQINHFRDTIALCAQELRWTSVNGEVHNIQYENGIYPRLQLVTKSGIREMVPPMDGFAMHECWDEQGDGFYWCGRSGVFYCDLDTREQVKVSPKGVHAMMSIDKNLVVSDVTIGKDYRGHPWKVYLHDRTQDEGIWICSYMPGIATPEKPSKLHPDPHPQFVCGDKYIVWTKMRDDHRMDLAITPVAEAKALLDVSAREKHNIIQNRIGFEELKESLVMDRKWVPYPSYSDRQGWDELLGDLKPEVIKSGEAYQDYQWKLPLATDYLEFDKSGDRAVMENTLNGNGLAIARLLGAELAEGQGRFIPQLVNGIFLTCEMTSWVSSAHLAILSKSRQTLPGKDDNTLDLTQGEISQTLAWAYYFLKEQFDAIHPGISKRIKEELECKEMDSYLSRTDFWWMGFEKCPQILNNWNPWCNSNALLTFMLMEEDRDRLAEAVWKSVRSVDIYLNSITRDGGIEEGPTYWGHSAGKVYDYLYNLYLITGGKASLFDNQRVRDMGEFIARSYIGNLKVVNFADAGPDVPGNIAGLIYRYGKACGSGLMQGCAAEIQRLRPDVIMPKLDMIRYFESLRARSGLESCGAPSAPAGYTWYPDTRFHYDSTAEGLFLAAKGGHNNESHNHNDTGSFILYFDSCPVIIDVGVGTYTRQTFDPAERYSIWTMQSNYHNLPMINGVAQMQGSEFRAKRVSSSKDSFSADIAGAYPAEAAVKSWKRTLELEGNRLIVSESFSLEKALDYNRINLMTCGEVKRTDDGEVVIETRGKTAKIDYDPVVFSLVVEEIELEDKKLSNMWGEKVLRISLVAKEKTLTGIYSYTISKV